MRLRFFMAVLLLASASHGRSSMGNHADRNLPIILEAWKHRVEMNRGVHAWNRRNDGMRVFQGWVALLTLAKSGTEEERRRTGLALEEYVVGGNIGPLGFIGTSLPVPGYDQGDFDMSLMGCTSLIGLFAEDRVLLTDATLVHLVKNVIRTWGQKHKAHFEVGFVTVPETENHLFMSESTRFLTNQLIWENRRGLPELAALRDSLSRAGEVLDNGQGTLKRMLLKLMQRTMRNGFFEFNAQVYQRFTIHALDNLYSFSADAAVANGAACLLDYLSALFAFQSYDGVRYGPFRRSSETYLDSSLIGRDAACSFFALQSGAFAWRADARRGLWHSSTAHASMALFSAVLKYRVPDPILAFMQERPAEYRAEIRSAYAGSGSKKRPTEIYHGSSHFLLTAGGRYESYAGPNFPTPGLWFRKAPWVYDVITRSSTLILEPRSERPGKIGDLLHFRGSQWRANNLAVHRGFMYGYAASRTHNNPDWPQHVPSAWPRDGETHSTRDFDFRFLDRSDVGVYIVLGRLRPRKTYFKWDYQKYLRGTVEVVDASRIGSLEELKFATLRNNSMRPRWPLVPRRYVYVNLNGTRLHLNPRYDGARDGIARIEEGEETDGAGSLAFSLPFRFPWLDNPAVGEGVGMAGFFPGGGSERPLFQVDLYAPWRGRAAFSDGEGNMYVFNPATGGYSLSNFRAWWNPQRKIVLSKPVEGPGGGGRKGDMDPPPGETPGGNSYIGSP